MFFWFGYHELVQPGGWTQYVPVVNESSSLAVILVLAHGWALFVTAAALVSENKVLAHPASVDSITTSGNKEDFVSMGMTAAIKLKRIVDNTRYVLAIEAMAAAQALDFLAPLKSSPRGQAAHAAIRSVCPAMEKDRVMYHDFARISELIASGAVAAALR